MKKYFILIGSFLILLSGCAIFSSNITFTPVDGLKKMKLSSRTIPAKISKESDKTLEAQGYAYIGFARSEDVVKTCWEDDCRNFTCSEKLSHRDTTKEVLDEAAAHGGDVVILQKDATLSTDSTTKEGKCIGWRDRDIQVSYCCEHRSGYCQRTCFRTQTVRDCTNHENIYGKKCSFITDGKVWRYDPELIKDLAKIEREKKLKLAEIAREKKILNIESAANKEQYMVMQRAYELRFQEDRKKGLSRVGPPAVKVGGKYGFQESVQSNKIIINPQYTDVYYTWSEDLIAASVGEKDRQLWGFIDMTGKWVISPSYQAAKNFCDGVAAVRVNNKYGYIDKKGEFIVKPKFDIAWDFMQGIARVRVGNKKGYVNKLGEVFMEP
jgi:hypothetical protein